MTTIHRGVFPAHALVVDVGLLGFEEAKRRVAAVWTPGSDLRRLAETYWLVILAEPVELRSEQAPGLVLVGDPETLAVPGLTARPGSVTRRLAGVLRHDEIALLPPVSMADWFDFGDHDIRRLEPVRAVPGPPVEPEEPATPVPDLRRAAGLRPIGRRRLGRITKEGARSGVRWGVVAAAVAVIALIAVGVALLVTPSSPGGSSSTITAPASDNPWGFRIPWLPLAFFVAIGLRQLFRIGRRGVGGRATGIRRRRGWFARVVLRSPAQGFVLRRQERYLRSLTASFAGRQWREALSQAVALGGSDGPSWLNLRLPKKRDDLRWTSGAAGGGTLPLGRTAYLHLRELYLAAAEQLEKAGDIDLAVFVHAELLHDTAAGVALLERTNRLRNAAELAEARQLAPEMLVRLWWRAGDRERAVDIARSRGAFAPAIERLAAVDPTAARALREQWVSACRRAGDHLATVAAAWPEPSLRPSVETDIEAGIALAGPTSGELLAYLVTGVPAAATTDRALRLLADDRPEQRRARDGFVATLAGLPGSDQVQDRRVCTAAIRWLLRQPSTRQSRQQLRLLRRRADPLLMADLPRLAATRVPLVQGATDILAPEEPGQVPIWDAVTLTGRGIIAACGDLGVRLLTLDGRVRARWDLPAHRIVVADHGSGALVVREAGSSTEIHRLDLMTLRMRPWTVLRRANLVPSYDGGVATIVDANGIAFLDVLSDRPRVLWRELDNTYRVLRINRTPGRLTALVEVPAPLPGAERSLQLFGWELPSLMLRLRRPLPADPDRQQAAVQDDAVTFLTGADGSDPKLVRFGGHQPPVTTDTLAGMSISASGAALAACRPLDDGRRSVSVGLGDGQPSVQVVFPADAEDIVMREHAGLVTLSDRLGRIVSADPAGGVLLTRLRTVL